jgi:hypothetical protein
VPTLTEQQLKEAEEIKKKILESLGSNLNS